MHQVDYHIGLLRGFLIATNAHQTILHALEVVLTHKQNNGEVIGKAEPVKITEIREAAKTIEVTKEEKEAAEQEIEKKKVFSRWTPEETDQIKKLHNSGATVGAISSVMNKAYSKIYSKLVSLGLTPKTGK